MSSASGIEPATGRKRHFTKSGTTRSYEATAGTLLSGPRLGATVVTPRGGAS
jgi:hypothetical protein